MTRTKESAPRDILGLRFHLIIASGQRHAQSAVSAPSAYPHTPFLRDVDPRLRALTFWSPGKLVHDWYPKRVQEDKDDEHAPSNAGDRCRSDLDRGLH